MRAESVVVELSPDDALTEIAPALAACWSKCVVRYDNERGKGDHRHYAGRESAYRFVDVDKLLVDFMRDIERWRDENGNS